jgi:hypothetical protein
VAVVVALVPDLLFGSKVQAMLAGAGHDVRLCSDPAAVSDVLPDAAVLVVDLTSDTLDGAAVVAGLRDGGGLGATRTLGFYSHVDQETRERAEAAGFDLVIPRSRMAREGDQVVARLAAS